MSRTDNGGPSLLVLALLSGSCSPTSYPDLTEAHDPYLDQHTS